MKVLLFGAGGQLATDLALESQVRGHEIHALRREECDITDSLEVLRQISTVRPEWVINAAAYNWVDVAESDPVTAFRVNGSAVGNIARACQDTGAVLLHYSTDYVFSGDKGAPYTEEDTPGPLSAYGISKLAGELFARSCCESHYVLRVAGLYGPHGRYTRRGNFVEFALQGCTEGRPLRIVSDVVASPTFGPALAARSLDILERRIPFGLYHLAGGEAVTWLEFARRIALAAGCPGEILGTTSCEQDLSARRPPFAALSNQRVEKAGIEPMPAIDECLPEYLALRRRGRFPGGANGNPKYSDRERV